MKLSVLVIDDEQTVLRTFRLRLSEWGYEVFLASDGPSGLEILSKANIQVVLSDLRMPGMSGQEVIKRIVTDYPNVKVVAITGYATVETTVEVMKSGAYDFIVKPLNFEQVRMTLNRVEEQTRLQEENLTLINRVQALSQDASERYRYDNLIGKSKRMKAVFSQIETVAPLETTVLIYGETGTGKELTARAIHHNSKRKSGPMVTVDCGTLSETLLEAELFGFEKGAFTGAQARKQGLFEQAHGGTIFLDEVSNASQMVQQKLLRLIQEKSFQRVGGRESIKSDTRIIAASNKPLLDLVRNNQFRQDLYYRLNVVNIVLPPLRQRGEDILLLARYMLNHHAKVLDRKPIKISPSACRQLETHSWPGNVRELFYVIERSIIMTPGDTIEQFFLDDNINIAESDHEKPVSLTPSLPEQVAMLERTYLETALRRYHGRILSVVKRSGLNPRTLNRKMKRYNLNKGDFK
ncbi:acetoacetate metabolism regulatory protein AtoC [Desulfosarcina alkanivorans]|uniref:Acetoacetate metabolism regulatory protein AtoC n=1 Tax=Desulfosarcina alkanivorans TaxID=571177 RepID=A0A5K7YHI7_9BACT|nr:sigma-54 dependent transcriptional regulator [Desulfosarcina alkanivorans]BBO68023.1 acetoacetate metabolism regulatory protein AtoC [Desulfosarcina alkanivorans]